MTTRGGKCVRYRETVSPVAAAIDVGTHSVRALLASFREDGQYRLLDDLRIPTGLGQGLKFSGRIGPQGRQNLTDALLLLFRLIRRANIKTVSLIATSALRTANNGPEILEEIGDRFSVPATAINGAEEARLIFKSARCSLGLFGQAFTLIDIGAGSVELGMSSLVGEPDRMLSLEIGAQYLADLFQRTDPLAPSDWCRIADHVRDSLAATPLARCRYPAQGVGAGGTFTTLANVHLKASGVEHPLHGYSVRAEELELLALRLAFTSRAELRKVPGISLDRVGIVPAGTCLAFHLIRYLGLSSLTICDRGLREGLLVELIEKETGRPPKPADGGMRPA